MRSSVELKIGAITLTVLAILFFIAGAIHAFSGSPYAPHLRWHRNAVAKTMQTATLFGISSVAWAGHLVHVAIPSSRGYHVTWSNLAITLPAPRGLIPFVTGNWAHYAQHPDRAFHSFGELDPW